MSYGIAAGLSAVVGLLLIVFGRRLAAARVREQGEWFNAPTDERALKRMHVLIVCAGCFILAMSLVMAATWRGELPDR